MRPGTTVSAVMTSRVHVARPMTPSKRLVQLIEENKISAVPIVDAHGTPVGVVSESDLLGAKAEGVFAWEIMTKPPISVRSNATLPQAARLMRERNVRRLVVVDERDKIVGVVSRSDLLQIVLPPNAGSFGPPHNRPARTSSRSTVQFHFQRGKRP